MKLKLEHRKQEIVPLPNFFLRLLRYGLFCIMLMIFSVGIGICGYHYFGKLNWLDSFHMSCMILTGMGPVAEMTSAKAKLFSSFYALYSGIAFLSITVVFLTPIFHRILHILHVESDDDNK